MNYQELEVLVVKAKNKDQVAIEGLLKTYRGFIIKAASRVYIDGYDMNDLIQIGNMSILKAIDNYTAGKGTFTGYVTFAITNNFNYLIRQRVRKNLTQSLDAPVSKDLTLLDLLVDEFSTEDDYVQKEHYEALRKAVDNLSAKLRDVIHFVYLDSLGSLKEYSKINNINYNTVIKRKDLAFEKLRAMVEI
ncbi:MAG: sigma-70 family RNA polymerase sigma factor [Clostridium sp.]